MKKYLLILIITVLLSGCNPNFNEAFVDSAPCNDKDGYHKINGKVIYCAFLNKMIAWELKNADFDSFEVLNNGYAKDKNNVYFCKNQLNNASPNSFKILSNGYSKDKNQIYFRENIFDKNLEIGGIKALSTPNVSTFEIVGSGYVKDDKNIFYHNLVINDPIVDAKTFYVDEKGVARDKNQIYFNGIPQKIIKDTKSFSLLKGNYAKDQFNIYFLSENTQILENVDQESFQVLEPKDFMFYMGISLAKDKNFIYFNSNNIPEIDVNTFEILDNSVIKDKTKVFRVFSKLLSFPNVDASSFIAIDSEFYKDKNYVFQFDQFEAEKDEKQRTIKILDNFDSESFMVFANFVKDKNAVYHRAHYNPCNNQGLCSSEYKLEKVPNADPESFEEIVYGYAKDKEKVYRFDSTNVEIIEGVDPNSFVPN